MEGRKMKKLKRTFITTTIFFIGCSLVIGQEITKEVISKDTSKTEKEVMKKKNEHEMEINQCIEILGGGENIKKQEIETAMEKLEWYGELSLGKLFKVFENIDKEDLSNINRRMNSITVLGNIGSKKAINPLKELVDGNAIIDLEKEQAEKALKRLEEQRVLYNRASYSSEDAVIYAFSARIIDFKKKSIDYLSNALKAYNWEVRLDALAALLMIKEKMNVNLIIQLLKDEHEDIRQNAAAVLAVYKDKNSFNPLIEALQDEATWVRYNVIKALEAIGDPNAIVHIEKFKKDSNENVRDSAKKAIKILEKRR
jgi:HEAT repeat protein